MEKDSDIPGVTCMNTRTNYGEGIWLTSFYVHHQLTKEEAEKFGRALELMLPSVLKMMMSL